MFIQDHFGEASSSSRCRSIPSSKSVSFSTSLSSSIWAPWRAVNTAFCSNCLNTLYPPPPPPCNVDINKRLLSTLALLACFRASLVKHQLHVLQIYQPNSCHISDPVTACSCTLLQDSPLLLLTFRIPHTRLTTAGQQAISFTGPFNWNSLPLSFNSPLKCKSNPMIFLFLKCSFQLPSC